MEVQPQTIQQPLHCTAQSSPCLLRGWLAGGLAGGRGRGGLYIRQRGGATRWIRFLSQKSCNQYLGTKQSSLNRRLLRGERTPFSFNSGDYPGVTWEWRGGNGDPPEDWVLAEGHDPKEEDEDEDGKGGEGGGA